MLRAKESWVGVTASSESDHIGLVSFLLRAEWHQLYYLVL